MDEVHVAIVAAASVVPSPIIDGGSPLATELETLWLSLGGSRERGEAPNNGGRGGEAVVVVGRVHEALLLLRLTGSLLVEVLHDLLEHSLAKNLIIY
jgi:hypothetical protein